ncbi:MAG: hypothetical protein MJZ16_01195 [Bacteroidales bacterium]|nr:hypothetical protein [Bacteroidales bacterium]
MRYRFRVTLTGIKGFYRVYELEGSMTLYTFHKQMRSDMEFPQDQLILFKMLDASGNVLARYGLFDLGVGTVDQITIANAVENGCASFVFFYDVTNKKSVNITFEEAIETKSKIKLAAPTVVDTKGPNPIEFENGYVAYEDLPDEQRHLPGDPGWDDFGADDDDDIDLDGDSEEEDDDEDGKEIYDGEEI